MEGREENVPMIRVPLSDAAYTKLLHAAAEEWRPFQWHAAYLLQRHFGVSKEEVRQHLEAASKTSKVRVLKPERRSAARPVGEGLPAS